jgi:hypothetical protein
VPRISTTIFSGARTSVCPSAAASASSTARTTRKCWSCACTPEILAAQRLPDRPKDEEEFWRDRYRSIVELENHLTRNGTRIIKFFLHLSKEEQRRRFLSRIDDPDKNWKFSPADVTERTFWKKYMKAYEACLGATSTKHAPWYVVPADDKQNAQLIVSAVILETMKDLGLAYPKMDARRVRELKSIRRRLATS